MPEQQEAEMILCCHGLPKGRQAIIWRHKNNLANEEMTNT
jgi:hypothetical protein